MYKYIVKMMVLLFCCSIFVAVLGFGALMLNISKSFSYAQEPSSLELHRLLYFLMILSPLIIASIGKFMDYKHEIKNSDKGLS